MNIPTEEELIGAITDATRSAVAALFRQHPGAYYYCSLITTGEAHSPTLAAWSDEALAEAATSPRDKELLKWSYAESPFLSYGQEFFGSVDALFQRRPAMSVQMSDAEWQSEYEVRLRAMEAAMARLDREGLFGRGEKRQRIVINVEIMPPDHTNTLRARRLNPPEALTIWLLEAAEPVPEA